MAASKVCLVLAILCASTNARFNQESFKSPADRNYPWIRQDFGPSEDSPSFSRFSELKKRQSAVDSTEPFHESKEWFVTKKIPRENKSFKKLVSPFYTITENDAKKYKDIALKSGLPYCQKIKTKRSDSNAKDSMVCYKCKNPKNGSTYEQCVYVSQPITDSSDLDDVVATPSGFRSKRSNSGEEFSRFKSSDNYRDHGSPYRFNEKLFSDATDDVPAEYKNKDERCEKVVKDSMVCMVCKDMKSNGKYEQCSYVRQPNEKKYTYSKSSSYKNPERRASKEDEDFESKPVRERSDLESEKPDRGSHEESKESNCKQVEKDSKTCTVCKDPDTGANYEKCSYTYQPDDKVYKFSSSKSIGSPRSSKDSPSYEGKSSEKLERDDEYRSDYSIPESYYEKRQSPGSSSYFKDDEPSSDSESFDYEKSRSESEKIAKSMEPSNCKEVQKDSMTCKVCKDPKTGSNSEQCSYRYQPTDKSFSYTKSKSFGTPTKAEDRSYDGSENKESSEPKSSFEERAYESKPEAKQEFTTKSAPKKVEADFYDAFKKKAEIQKVLQEFQKEDRSNCKKLMRDKMTCYQCVDEKGFHKEECAFVTADEPGEDKAEYAESKEVQVEPVKKSRSMLIEKRMDNVPLDADASASENVYSKRELPGTKNSEEDEAKEAEAYEYVAETRPVFDKVLGLTLPAYMLSTSDHEEEFDRIVSSSRF
ncbi:uncharacterized protein LOC143340623 [Colletes latitarsis]|uniref:uncharacterized protein LOC143340623 n=1 Tax=Colletes latitarsis TaxID=2605962 RepID=UPI0040363899